MLIFSSFINCVKCLKIVQGAKGRQLVWDAEGAESDWQRLTYLERTANNRKDDDGEDRDNNAIMAC